MVQRGVLFALAALGACSDPPAVLPVERVAVEAPALSADDAAELVRERTGVARIGSDARDAWTVAVGETVSVELPWRAGTLATIESAASVLVDRGGPRAGRVRLALGPKGGGDPWWSREFDLADDARSWRPVTHKVAGTGDRLPMELRAAWVGEPPSGAEKVRGAFELPVQARKRPGVRAGTPNVLLITVDTLRPDRLGCYGYGKPTSPHIDALAARGARFAITYSSAPWTLPSYGSLFTGLLPCAHRAGVVTERDALFGTDMDAPAKRTTELLRADLTTLAERFSSAGFATAMFHNNPYLSRESGLERGFERYVAYGSNAKNGVDVALDWIDDVRGAPWLCVVHLMDPHFPYAPPAPFDERFAGRKFESIPDWRPNLDTLRAGRPSDDVARLLSDLYDGEIAFTDDQIGRLLDELRQRDLADDTIVVLHSDHGEEFWEHGSCDHGHAQHEELLRVPLVIAWPGHVPSGHVAEDRVRALDLHATLLELCGLPVPGDIESRSLVPLFKAREAPRRAIAEAVQRGDREIKAAIDGPHKLVVRGAQESVYDLDRDPGELSALAVPDAQAVARLRTLLREHRKCSDDGAKRARALELDADKRAAIQRLGYGGDGDE